MPDFKKMTLQSLRELARKVLGPGHSRLTKSELVEALEAAQSRPRASPPPKTQKAPPRGAAAARGTPADAHRKTPVGASATSPEAARVRGAAGVRAVATRAAEATGKAVRGAAEATGKAVRAAREAAEATGKAARDAAEAAGKVARGAAEATGKAVQAARDAAEATGKAAREAAASSRMKKGAGVGAAVGAAVGSKPARARKAGAAAVGAAAAAGAAVGAAVGAAAGAVRAKQAARKARPGQGAPDAEGFFVARVRGEDAAREAPRQLTEADPGEGDESAEEGAWNEGVPASVPPYDEGLGELPWGYGDDAFVALARDPRTLFVYWDLARETTDAGFAGLDHPRAQLWVFARSGGGWDRVRSVDFALDSRGFYLHDLEPGRTYRVEIHAIDRQGRERIVGVPSNEAGLPPVGLSPVIDDRFIRIPWQLPLGQLLGPGHAGGPFSDEARALLARLSDWSRFAGRTWGGGSAGGMGGRPSSPISSPSGPPGSSGTGDE